MIQIPDVCPQCCNPIVISKQYPGSQKTDSSFDKVCPHTQTYTNVWKMRIFDIKDIRPVGAKIMSAGMSCKRCGDFNSYGEPNMPDGSYKCFSCRRT